MSALGAAWSASAPALRAAVFLYVLALPAFVVAIRADRNDVPWRRGARLLLALAAAANLLALAQDWTSVGCSALLQDLVSAWGLVAFLLTLPLLLGSRGADRVSVWGLVLLLAGFAGAALVAPEGPADPGLAQGSLGFQLHRAAALAGLAALGLAAAHALAQGTDASEDALPWLRVALGLRLLALALGVLWSRTWLGTFDGGTPAALHGQLALLLACAVALHLRQVPPWRGRVFRGALLAAFVLALLQPFLEHAWLSSPVLPASSPSSEPS